MTPPRKLPHKYILKQYFCQLFYLFFQLEQFALAFRGASWMFNAVRDTCCSRHTLFSESAASTRRESQDDLLRANPRDENNMFHDVTNN